MISLHRVCLLTCLKLITMLSCALSRSLWQVAAEVTRTSHPNFFRAFATTRPKCGEESSKASVVTYPQLKSMLSSHDIQLYDVRNPDEYQAGYIPDAVNIPLGNLEESMKLSPEKFQRKFKVRAPGKDDSNIVLYCKSGNRSAKALDIARLLGFSRARHYKGGYTEWAQLEGK